MCYTDEVLLKQFITWDMPSSQIHFKPIKLKNGCRGLCTGSLPRCYTWAVGPYICGLPVAPEDIPVPGTCKCYVIWKQGLCSVEMTLAYPSEPSMIPGPL